MRVRRTPDLPSLILLGQTVRLDKLVSGSDDDDDGTSLIDMLQAPELPEDVNEVVRTSIFCALTPGTERTCLVLLSEGFTYPSIASITGLTEREIRAAVASGRKKIKDQGSRHQWAQELQPAPFRAWNRLTRTMSFTHTPQSLSPKKVYRLMRPTSMQDAQGRLVYEWDILEQGEQLRICSYWKNALSAGFCLQPSWVSRSIVVGNIYQDPLLEARARQQRMP